MDINEVPQDRRDFDTGNKVKKLLYAVDKDGKYTGVNSAGWEAENFAMKQAWDDIHERLAHTEADVYAGKLSPIAYFMEKNLMDIGLLSKYAGKWQWQVKRHFKPGVFKKLNAATLDKYARIFNITTGELASFGKGEKGHS